MTENPRGKNVVSEKRKKRIKDIADREARKEQVHRMGSVLLQNLLGNTVSLKLRGRDDAALTFAETIQRHAFCPHL